jgi:diacylglycerol kinase family enzyme
LSYAAVVNRNSGYVMTHSPALVRAMLENATRGELGLLRMVEGPQIERALEEAFGGAHAAVIVLGGDGTARTAAAHAMRTGVPVIPLPGGTMNLLPRRLYGEGDPSECLRLALEGGTRCVDVGEVAGKLFFLQGFFGVAPNIARAREAARGLTSLEDLPLVLDNARKAIGAMFGHDDLQWRIGGAGPTHTADTLVVSLGSLDRVMNPSAHVSARDFEVIGIDVHNLAEIARLGFNALTQQWRDDPGVEVAHTTRLDVRLCEDDPCAVLDGEPVALPVEVTVNYLRDAVPVVAPPDAQP